ncbi:MAG TPA: GntR family transcriptional regulator [Stellaceae bacterium]|nr:GntR family transcriptional regulator [Stellaceae bacterium]
MSQTVRTRPSRPPETGRFLYKSVSSALRERMDSGSYAPGARIPTVGELAAEFGVSTITVRRAIRDLSLEGRLTGRQGLGVFVAKQQRMVRRLRASSIAPIEEDMRRAGFEPSVRDLDMSLVVGDRDPAAKPLGRGGKATYRLERVLLADGEPVALDTIWLPRSLGDALKSELPGHFVMSLIAAHGIPLDHIDYELEGANATDAQAALLNVMSGFPLLVIRYTPIGLDGLPMLKGRTTSRADRFTYEFCARPELHRRG